MKNQDWRVDPVLLLLLGAIVFFTLVMIYASHLFPTNQVLFQTISGLLTGFSGAFIMRVNPKSMSQQDSDTAASNTPQEKP